MPKTVNGLYVSVEPETRAKIGRLVKNLSAREFSKAMRGALRQAAAPVRKELRARIEERYSLAGAGGYTANAATSGRVTGTAYEIVTRGSRIPLVRFMTDKGDDRAGRPPSVNVAKPHTLSPGSFYGRVNVNARTGGTAKHHDMLFERVGGTYKNRYKLGEAAGDGRGKIRGLMAASIPNMTEAEEIKGPMSETAGETVSGALAKAVDRAFGR